MVRTTTAADDESNTTTTTTARIYHRKFATEDGDRHEDGADLGMGYDFAVDHGVDPSDPAVFDDAYEFAGTVDVDVGPSDAPEAAAYSAWEDGEGHDPASTRSMAVGDVIVIEDAGDDFGFFVDSIGFEEIDVSAFTTPDTDDDVNDATAFIGEVIDARKAVEACDVTLSAGGHHTVDDFDDDGNHDGDDTPFAVIHFTVDGDAPAYKVQDAVDAVGDKGFDVSGPDIRRSWSSPGRNGKPVGEPPEDDDAYSHRFEYVARKPLN